MTGGVSARQVVKVPFKLRELYLFSIASLVAMMSGYHAIAQSAGSVPLSSGTFSQSAADLFIVQNLATSRLQTPSTIRFPTQQVIPYPPGLRRLPGFEDFDAVGLDQPPNVDGDLSVVQTVPAVLLQSAIKKNSRIVATSIEARPNQRPLAVQAIDPIQTGSTGSIDNGETNAFEETGIAFGSFRLFPKLGLRGTHIDNIDYDETGNATKSILFTSSLTVKSIWDRHALNLDLSATREVFETDRENEDTVSLDTSLQFDLFDQTRLTLNGAYFFQRESSSSAETGNVSARANLEKYTFMPSIEQDVFAFRFRLKGTLEIDDYENVPNASSRDSRFSELELRTGYQFTPGVQTWLQASVSKRKNSSAGSSQDGRGRSLSAGVTLDFGEKLRGDISAGWLVWNPGQQQYTSTSGVLFNAELVWSPIRLTTLTFMFESSLAPTTIAGASTVLTHNGRIRLERSIRHNIDADMELQYGQSVYEGAGRTDKNASVSIGGAWHINRNADVTARYKFEKRISNNPGSDYEVNTVSIGLELKR
ncbi:MAG: outer membrane beta-barrel protein [Cohaesibacteraceae bacterium]|nr:outer membrane beta-barrel protein [Cohaesibacteraceae bacterium]